MRTACRFLVAAARCFMKDAPPTYAVLIVFVGCFVLGAVCRRLGVNDDIGAIAGCVFAIYCYQEEFSPKGTDDDA
jgi:hypothetical protein